MLKHFWNIYLILLLKTTPKFCNLLKTQIESHNSFICFTELEFINMFMYLKKLEVFGVAWLLF